MGWPVYTSGEPTKRPTRAHGGAAQPNHSQGRRERERDLTATRRILSSPARRIPRRHPSSNVAVGEGGRPSLSEYGRAPGTRGVEKPSDLRDKGISR
uniref:Uncharacterized protein n=1 Tax=Oryza glumipatula TaxID=40148 RepID=A0A0E0AKW0_9ORYZ